MSFFFCVNILTSSRDKDPLLCYACENDNNSFATLYFFFFYILLCGDGRTEIFSAAVHTSYMSVEWFKGEPTLILWMPNPGFIPKPFDVSEFHSHFRHSREGDTLEFEVSLVIRPLLGVGKVVNWA